MAAEEQPFDRRSNFIIMSLFSGKNVCFQNIMSRMYNVMLFIISFIVPIDTFIPLSSNAKSHDDDSQRHLHTPISQQEMPKPTNPPCKCNDILRPQIIELQSLLSQLSDLLNKVNMVIDVNSENRSRNSDQAKQTTQGQTSDITVPKEILPTFSEVVRGLTGNATEGISKTILSVIAEPTVKPINLMKPENGKKNENFNESGRASSGMKLKDDVIGLQSKQMQSKIESERNDQAKNLVTYTTQSPSKSSTSNLSNSSSKQNQRSKLLFLQDSILKSVNKKTIDHSCNTMSATRHTFTIDDLDKIQNVNQAPDIIFIHTGINDLKVSDPNKTAKIMSQQVIHIKNTYPDAHIIISSVCPVRDHTLDNKREIFNANVKSNLKFQKNISFVMHDSISVSSSKYISSDNIHPTNIGASIITRNIIAHLTSLKKTAFIPSPLKTQIRRPLLPTPLHFRHPHQLPLLPPPPPPPPRGFFGKASPDRGFFSSPQLHPFLSQFYPPSPSYIPIQPPPRFLRPSISTHPWQQQPPYSMRRNIYGAENFWRNHIQDY